MNLWLRACALGGAAMALAASAPAWAVDAPQISQLYDAGYFDTDGVAQSGDHGVVHVAGTWNAAFGGFISTATTTASPGPADPSLPGGAFVKGDVTATVGGTAAIITKLDYFVQVSGAYDDSIFVPLSGDIYASIAGTIGGGTTDASVTTNAIVAMNFYADEARTLSDSARTTYDHLGDSLYGDGSYAQTLATTLALMVHPGETFDIHLEVTTFGYVKSGVGNVHAEALADPYFYFAPGSDYSLSFSPGVVNAAVPDAVPEPTSWALMLLGFGAIGTAARRRRTTALA